MNTAGSVQQAWPDPTACFVRSVVTLLTRFVLTQTSPLECHMNFFFFFGGVLFILIARLLPSNFTRIHAHLQILQPQLYLSICVPAIDDAEKKRQSGTTISSLLVWGTWRVPFSNASVRQSASKHNSCSVHTFVALKTNRALFPADRDIRSGFMLVLAHNRTSGDLWPWHWPLLFQGLGAETDVGKLPRLWTRKRGPLVKRLFFFPRLGESKPQNGRWV